MRKEPFSSPGTPVGSSSHASPWWVGLALVLAMLIYFRSAGFLFGRWMERHFGCTLSEAARRHR